MFFMEKRNNSLKSRLQRWTDSDDLNDFEHRKSERESNANEWKTKYGRLSNDDVKDVIDDIVKEVSHEYDSDDYFRFVDIFVNEVPKNFLKLGPDAVEGMYLRAWFHVPNGSEEDVKYLLHNSYKFREYVQRAYGLGIHEMDKDIDFSEYENDIGLDIAIMAGTDELKGLSKKQYKREVVNRFVEGIDGFCKAMNRALETE